MQAELLRHVCGKQPGETGSEKFVFKPKPCIAMVFFLIQFLPNYIPDLNKTYQFESATTCFIISFT